MPEEGIIFKDCKCADCKFAKLPEKPEGFKISVGHGASYHNISSMFCGAMNLMWPLMRMPLAGTETTIPDEEVYYYTDIQDCEGYEPKRVKV